MSIVPRNTVRTLTVRHDKHKYMLLDIPGTRVKAHHEWAAQTDWEGNTIGDDWKEI